MQLSSLCVLHSIFFIPLPFLLLYLILRLVDYYSGVLFVSCSPPLTYMTVKGGTSQACAACKYQRRKCMKDCPLAPHFPPDQPKMFQNAHRLYGVSNILKILKHLNPVLKIEAMRSIIYQSEMRDKFPVRGCAGIVDNLRQQIIQAHEELDAVNKELALYRQHHDNQISSPQFQIETTKNVLPLFEQSPHQPFDSIPTEMPLAHPFTNGNSAANYIDLENNKLWIQQLYSNNNLATIQQQLLASQAFPFQEQTMDVCQDYDEISPVFFDTIDDRQSYVDSKETYESSSESSMRDTRQSIEHVADNELKSAAARLSLTSII
ncbi:hypothetical protein IFM89_015142 [Coptis chinensis]|uniref:LOB domain-containing protein n=1 Tax=Coptis chinensis TaxID=261450 RepID=A0A835HSS5_9MAGN|nr:hypothetical protein IFM89_015142 [Coptis chinensis]